MIEILEYTELACDGVERAWSDLEREGGCPHVFLSPAWVRPWARHFAAGASPLVLVALSGDGAGSRAVGLAPLFRSASGRLELPVNSVSQRGGFVAAPDATRESGVPSGGVLAAFLKHVAGRRERLLLRSLTSPVADAVRREGSAAGLLLNTLPARVSPAVDTTGGWEAFLDSKPRKVTHEWERKMRKLERAGRFEVKRLVPGSSPRAFVDAMVELEERSWKGESGTSIAARGHAAFYHELAESLTADPPERTEFLPFWLELDGKLVGFLLGIVYRGVYYALKTSFDEDYRKLSPGVTLFHHAIRYAFETDISRFDFVGQRARWKDEWATGHTEHTTLRCYPRSPRGLTEYLVDTHLKRLGRRVAGEGEV